jgi:hypothetical protein
MSVSVSFDRYYKYEELSDCLKQYAEKFPHLAALQSIGSSHEGRQIWAMTITNSATGSHDHKPAMYVDGNIHAGEVTGSMAALYLIDYLLTNYGCNETVTRLLDACTFYVLPRINPDGAELYLTSPTLLRSSVRPFPDYRKSEDPPGLHAEDIDGDGKILLMRLQDDLRGSWKIDGEDPRIMVERHPLDQTGPFYHVYTEGLLRDAKGQPAREVKLPLVQVPTKYGLDLNRNFPSGFSPLTPGAGVFPLSEPETRNQVEFVTGHPNIAGVLLYHTTGGVLFRPHSTIHDSKFDKKDIHLYEAIGQLGYESTGYPVVCCYGDIFSGVFDDWCFDQRGLLAFTPELWNAESRASGSEKVDFFKKQTSKEKRDIEHKLLIWNDRELSGRGFINWRPYDHPQLGQVEIGGWDTKECRQNPPPAFLKGECHKMTLFALSYAAALPHAVIEEVTVTALAPQLYQIEVLVANRGFLPTNITEQAVKQQAVRPDRVRIEVPDGVKLLGGESQMELGFLEGYALAQDVWGRYKSPSNQMARASWTVEVVGSEPHQVALSLLSERGGVSETIVDLA